MSERQLRRGNWSVQELERLRLLLPRRGIDTTAILLRRSAASVQRKALDLLRVPARRGDWTASDDTLLREAWGALDLRLLSAMLGRPAAEVRRRAGELQRSLRSGPWSRADQLSLKDLYGTRSDADLEVCLSRPRHEIAAMAARLCLAKDKRFVAPVEEPAAARRMPRWTAEQVEQLRQVYADRDNLAVARVLGRTVTSVANKANLLGLKKSPALLADIGRHNVRSRYRRDEGAAEA
jgi:hypothetical protein